jgi:hypothetical protein
MLANDIPKFSAMMAGIGELYGKSISAQLTDIYWRTLKSYEFQDVHQALQAHINNPDCGQYFPKPADVVRFIDGSGETKALQAWAKVEKAISRIGIYQSVAFDDPLIHAVLEDMGGWVKLCSMKNDQMPFCANEFQKRYMGFVIKKPHRYPRYLCGITECENAKNGYEVKAPILLGDAVKAEEVIKTGGGTPLLSQQSNKSLSELILQISKSPMDKNRDEL